MKHISPNDKITLKPFVYTRPSISSVSIRMLVLLFIQIFLLGFTKSYDALVVVITALLGALCSSALNYLISKEQPYNFLNVILQGLIIGLLLPATYPVPAVFFISFLTLFISRTIVFRNINSWINMTAFAAVLAWIIGKRFFPGFLITSDLITVKNPSVFMIQNGTFQISTFDSTVTNFLNNTVFSLFKITIPEGFVSLLWDNHSVIPAFRFGLLTIISSVVIFTDRAFSGYISGLFLLVYGLLVRLFGPVFFGGQFNQGDIILAMLSSGTLFGAIFMLQAYGTTPISILGKMIYGFTAGIIAFFIIGCGTSPIGMAYTILTSNILGMIIRVAEEIKNNRTLERVISNE